MDSQPLTERGWGKKHKHEERREGRRQRSGREDRTKICVKRKANDGG